MGQNNITLLNEELDKCHSFNDKEILVDIWLGIDRSTKGSRSNSVEFLSMFDRSSMNVRKIWDRCSIDVRSVFDRCSIDFRPIFHRCSIDVRQMFDRCSIIFL